MEQRYAGPTMPVPGAIYLECEPCEDITLHEVVHGKVSGKKLELQLRCKECGTKTFQIQDEVEMSTVKVVISDREQSRKSSVEIESDEVLMIGDELLVEGVPVRIRGIELGTDKRVNSARVSDIGTLWTVMFDKVVVKFSINMGRRTKAGRQIAAPDEEFTVGEMVEVAGTEAVIHRIKTWDKVLQYGSAEARDIRRIYGRAIRGPRR